MRVTVEPEAHEQHIACSVFVYIDCGWRSGYAAGGMQRFKVVWERMISIPDIYEGRVKCPSRDTSRTFGTSTTHIMPRAKSQPKWSRLQQLLGSCWKEHDLMTVTQAVGGRRLTRRQAGTSYGMQPPAKTIYEAYGQVLSAK